MKKKRNWVGHIFSAMFKIFPIKKKRIYFIARYGKQYSCNPKAYFEYLYKNHHDEFEFVWCLNDKNIKLPKDVKRTKFMSLRDQYYLHTSGIVVNNLRFSMLYGKRKGQIYIQTWHGGGPFILKKIEKDQGLSLFNRWNSQIDSQQIDILVAGSRKVQEIFEGCFFIDKNKIALTGSPRCDVLVNKDDSLIKKIKQKLNISQDDFVVLYAPTFREKQNFKELILNNDLIKESFECKTKKNIKLLYRFHPYLLTKEQKEMKFEDYCINVTTYPEMQDLILIADVMITDVSTCMCDMMVANKPCILYLKDYDKYLAEERGLYFSPSILPFPVVKNEEELKNCINNFDILSKQCVKGYKKFLNEFGNVESGNACQNLYKLMVEKMNSKK